MAGRAGVAVHTVMTSHFPVHVLVYVQEYTCRTVADSSSTSGHGSNLRLLSIQIHFCQKTSDALLELTVLGGIDERIDAAVGECQ